MPPNHLIRLFHNHLLLLVIDHKQERPPFRTQSVHTADGLYAVIESLSENVRSNHQKHHTAISEERPPTADILATRLVDLHNSYFFIIIGKFGQKFTLRTSDETVSPELNAIRLSGRIGLVSYPVYRNDRKTIGYGMPPLNSYPRS